MLRGRFFSLPGKRRLHVAVLYLVGDLAEGLAGLHVKLAALGQIPQRDHPYHLAPLQHGEAAHLLGRHDPGGLSGVVVGGHHRAVAGHDVLHLGLEGVLLRRHAAQDDVPVGDNAPQAAVLTADGQGAHVVPGQEPGRQGGRLAGGDGDHAGVHKIAYLHDKTAFLPNFTASLDGKGGFIPLSARDCAAEGRGPARRRPGPRTYPGPCGW